MYLYFCVWLISLAIVFSRLIYVVACVRSVCVNVCLTHDAKVLLFFAASIAGSKSHFSLILWLL